jgi:hypothetical protein
MTEEKLCDNCIGNKDWHRKNYTKDCPRCERLLDRLKARQNLFMVHAFLKNNNMVDSKAYQVFNDAKLRENILKFF